MYNTLKACWVCLFVFNFVSLAVLGLHCCARLSLAVASWGYSLVVMHKLLIAIVSLVAEHKLWSQRASEVAACRFSSCSSQALEHRLSSCIAPWHVRSSQIKGLSLCLLHWQEDSLPLSHQGSLLFCFVFK